MNKNIEELRKEVKKLRVDKGLDHKGSLQKIHDNIYDGTFPYQSLVMAMTGYRNSPRSGEILELVKEYLLSR